MLSKLKKELRAKANPEKAKIYQRFFKTGKGEYGEGDIFLGITVPEMRKIAKKYSDISLIEIESFLSSKVHEDRQVVLYILVDVFCASNQKDRTKIFNFYLKNTRYINNWDLVDLSADKIVGEYLLNRNKTVLYKLAKSQPKADQPWADKNLWEKRIAIVSTFQFIKNNQFSDTLKISKILLNDDHDLIHKACGWMLREVGKRDLRTEEKFLQQNYKAMPRTMLRYAIERFPEKKRQSYLKGRV